MTKVRYEFQLFANDPLSVGPAIPITITPPSYLWSSESESVPRKTTGRALLNTGSIWNRLSWNVRQQLQLQRVFGARESVYQAQFTMKDFASGEEISWCMPVISRSQDAPYPQTSAPTQQVVVHFGLEFLSKVEFNYDPASRKVTLEIKKPLDF